MYLQFCATLDGLAEIVNKMWNPFHSTKQYGRHNYINRLIEINEKNKYKANASWNLIGLFANKPTKDDNSNNESKQNDSTNDNSKDENKAPVTINVLIFKAEFVKIDKKWKANQITAKGDVMGVPLSNAMIEKGSIFDDLGKL